MKKERIVTIILILSVLTHLAGCNNKFWDPRQIGRFRPTPAVNVILDSLGVAEEAPPVWEGAEEPQPSDVIVYKTDYVLGSGDIVRISIFELFREGFMDTRDYVVTETGKISIPDIGVLEAAGLTESQLEERIKQILSPSILKEPSVNVTLLGSPRRTFSISGHGIRTPDRYTIPRYDFRLLEALATAGGWSQFNVSYIYVSRPVRARESQLMPIELIEPETFEVEPIEPEQTEVEPIELDVLEVEPIELEVPEVEPIEQELIEIEPEGTEGLIEPEQQMLEMIKPQAKRLSPDNSFVVTPAEMATAEELAGPTNQQQSRIEWIFKDGKWVPVQVSKPETAEPVIEFEPERVPELLREEVPEAFEWAPMPEEAAQARVIKIPADKLRSGDPRYNIVIKPGDSIQVPVDIIGECCIMGNVNRQGYIDITARPMTLKMAIAASGGLGPLAYPKRCEIVRRIGENREEIVMVDLDKIASGEQPDFFVKPHDLINVGTHPTSTWRAVLRNAFRATYGFGFIYDRNFAYRDYYGRNYSPIPPWKWESVF